MKVNQIATIMNSVFPNVIGNKDENGFVENIVLAEDASNIVDFGKAVNAQYQLGDNFNTYYKKIVDKVGEQIFIFDEWDKSGEIDIRKTGLEAGSIVEMVFFEDGEFVDNTSWNEIINGTQTAPPTFDQLFGYHPVPANSLYFNRKVTLASEVYTESRLQWKSAVLSVQGLTSFFDGIVQRWENKIEQLRQKLTKMQVCAWMAEKVQAGYNGVYNVLAAYKESNPTAITTTATAKRDKEFLRFAKAFIEIMRENLRDRTMLYNPYGYVGAVPRTRQKCYLYAPYAEYMSTVLYADTFHDDFVKLGGFYTVSYWQSVGNGVDDETKMQVAITTENSDGETVYIDGVLGVIFDDRAIFQVDENPRIVAQRNNMSEWTNYQHKLDVSLYATTAFNGCVFTISDYDFNRTVSTAQTAPSNWAAIIADGIYTKGADGSYTKVTTGTDWVQGTQYFTKIA